MPTRYRMFSSAVSTRRKTVNTPSMNIEGSTMAMNGTNTSRDPGDANPMATSELESEKTCNRDERAAASLTVARAAV